MSKSLLVIKASSNGTVIKSWAAKPFKFQWQNLMLDDRFGPELISISTDNKSRRWPGIKIINSNSCTK